MFDPKWLRYDAHGLIPCIAQDHTTGEVLMLAYDLAEADEETPEPAAAVQLPAGPYAAGPLNPDHMPAPVKPQLRRPATIPDGQKLLCPECGRMLTPRTSRTGSDFWGCSGFKNGCRYTRPMEPVKPPPPPLDPMTPKSAGARIGAAGAERVTKAIQDYAAATTPPGDPRAVRDFLYGKFDVTKMADLTVEQEEAIYLHLRDDPNEPVGEPPGDMKLPGL